MDATVWIVARTRALHHSRVWPLIPAAKARSSTDRHDAEIRPGAKATAEAARNFVVGPKGAGKGETPEHPCAEAIARRRSTPQYTRGTILHLTFAVYASHRSPYFARQTASSSRWRVTMSAT